VRVELSTERRAVLRLLVERFGPTSEGWSLIVNKKAAVFDSWGLLDFGGSEGVDGIVRFGSDVGKPVPWRDTDLLGDIVNAINRTAPIASYTTSDREKQLLLEAGAYQQ
jgi:hypothetical protein